MKTALVLLLSCAAFTWAQEKPAPEKTADGTKRLESVTWDLNTHKLVWVVQTGKEVNGEFVAASSNKYEVSPDEAAMMFADEKRGFTAEEAASLHHLLDVLSLYCAESTVWWEQGQGAPMDNKEKRTRTALPDAAKPAPEGKPVRVDQQQPAKKKPFRVADGDMIAANRNR